MAEDAGHILQAATFCANCNVILARAMQNAGAGDDLDACEEVCCSDPIAVAARACPCSVGLPPKSRSLSFIQHVSRPQADACVP